MRATWWFAKDFGMWGRSANELGERQPLTAHLEAVAARAGSFGRAFGGEDFCYWTGLWHDVGKASPEWQKYLSESEAGNWRSPKKPDHKCAGAVLAREAGSEPGIVVIHGHHGGLGDVRGQVAPWYQERQSLPATLAALDWARTELPRYGGQTRLGAADWVQDTASLDVFLRLAYSALVDADTLDAEHHALAGRPSMRGSDVTMAELWRRFEEFSASSPKSNGIVQAVRDEVLDACLAESESQPGWFRLTVPTGGGKTRSAMAFALRHAIANQLDRVIVAVPFTTITEQTAAVYRRIFERAGEPPVVLEHHSAAHERVANQDEGGCSHHEEWSRLAAENWDAPIVVTTTVQLFESLFSNRRSATRKVHRLANSIIILDEAQALPAGLLDPIIDGLTTLAANCRTSVILSTATQPAFHAIPCFAEVKATEIVPNHPEHFNKLRRVDWEWRMGPRTNWVDVANWLRSTPQSLTILNVKRHARELLDELADPDALHLSTLLCGAHRAQVLREVKERLISGKPCRLVATQVVEAGVDLDFPVVFRALGPVDSMIQAAGRCNREGRLGHRGQMVVFETPDGALPPGLYKTAADLAQLAVGSPDLTEPATVAQFSSLLMSVAGTDTKEVQSSRSDLNFPEVARRFRMIDHNPYDVVVPFGTPDERASVESAVERVRAGDPAVREIMRVLQPFIVSLREREALEGPSAEFIEEILPGLGWWTGGYGERGLEVRDPELIV